MRGRRILCKGFESLQARMYKKTCRRSGREHKAPAASYPLPRSPSSCQALVGPEAGWTAYVKHVKSWDPTVPANRFSIPACMRLPVPAQKQDKMRKPHATDTPRGASAIWFKGRRQHSVSFRQIPDALSAIKTLVSPFGLLLKPAARNHGILYTLQSIHLQQRYFSC